MLQSHLQRPAFIQVQALKMLHCKCSGWQRGGFCIAKNWFNSRLAWLTDYKTLLMIQLKVCQSSILNKVLGTVYLFIFFLNRHNSNKGLKSLQINLKYIFISWYKYAGILNDERAVCHHLIGSFFFLLSLQLMVSFIIHGILLLLLLSR